MWRTTHGLVTGSAVGVEESARCTAFALTPSTRAICEIGRPTLRSSVAIATRSGVITVGRPGRRPSRAADAMPARVCRLTSRRRSASSPANTPAGSTVTPTRAHSAGSLNERNPTPREVRPLTVARNCGTVGASIAARHHQRVSRLEKLEALSKPRTCAGVR